MQGSSAHPLRLIPLAVLLGACASGHRIPAVPEGEVPAMAGRECRYQTHPAAVGAGTLPPVTDPAWLADAAAEAGVTGPVTLSIRYDDDGRLDWVRPIPLADAPAHRLASAVRDAAPATSAAPWGARLVYAPGEPARVLPSVICDAAPEDANAITAATRGRVDMGIKPLSKNGRLKYVVRVLVAPDGSPVRAELAPTSARQGNLGQLLRESAMDQRYRPALHDGFPVAGEYTLEREIRWRTEVRTVRRPAGRG